MMRNGKFSPVDELGKIWVNPNGILEVEGVTFVATLGDGLFWHAKEEWRVIKDTPVLPSNDVTSIAKYADRLWVGTRSGLVSMPWVGSY